MMYYGVTDYVWIETNNCNIIDMADGNHYAGCRCSCSSHSLENCNNFESCLYSILRQFYKENYEDYKELRKTMKNNYKFVFNKVENEVRSKLENLDK